MSGAAAGTRESEGFGLRVLPWRDLAMLALALVSVVLVAWVSFFQVAGHTYHAVVVVDWTICAIFASEFGMRWRRARWAWNYPLIYWYEILGMIPVTSPWLRGFRLLRVVVIAVRLARLVDQFFGDQVTAVVVNRSVGTIVDIVKRPMTVAVLDEVAQVLSAGNYTENMAAALEENHAEIDAMIMESIKKDPTMGRVRYIPFHDEIMQLIADTTFRIVFRVLADARTDELVSDMLRENIDQIREAVRAKPAGDRAAVSVAGR